MWYAIDDLICRLVKGRERHGKAMIIAAGAVVCTLLFASTAIPVLRGPIIPIAVAVIVGFVLLAVLILFRLQSRADDLLASVALYANLVNEQRLPRMLLLDGAAANPSFQWFLEKCLVICKPKSILELGSGQTTRLLADYFHREAGVEVVTLEESETWRDIMVPQITRNGRHHDYRFLPLAATRFKCNGSGEAIRTTWYNDFAELANRKFDLVLVDGPSTTGPYSRSGVLQLLPHTLSDSFVVVFDDAERAGERMTVAAARRILASFSIPFETFEVHGVKTQVVLCSPKFAFLRSV